MKNFIFTLFLLCILAAGAFGQTKGGRYQIRMKLVGLGGYIELFEGSGRDYSRETYIPVAGDYYSKVTTDTARVSLTLFAQLDGNSHKWDGDSNKLISTELEWALASYYYADLRDIRPAEADAILPKNNPKLADQKLGAAVYQEIQILRFLADTAAVNRHEAVLKFITDRGNATRAEIETYYRNGIRGLVSAVVDEEFNKPSTNGVNPVAVYADWQRRGLVKDSSGRALNGIDLIKETLTNFFLNPSQENYVRLRGISARVSHRVEVDPLYETVNKGLGNTYYALSPELTSKLRSEFISERAVANFAALPNDPTFRIFEVTYAVYDR